MAEISLGIAPPDTDDYDPSDEIPVTELGGSTPEPAPSEPAPVAADIPEPVIRALLASAGGLLAMSPLADADVAGNWRFTETELDDLTPPLTRIANRRPAIQHALARGDELTVAIQLLGYTGRNVADAAAARHARQLLEDPQDDFFGNENPSTETGTSSAARGPFDGLGRNRADTTADSYAPTPQT